MAEVFGLDFGTTNSLAARVRQSGTREEADAYYDVTGAPYPSVVAFRGDDPLVGREAYDLLERTGTGVIDDAVRSPKSALGTGRRFNVGGRVREPAELASLIIKKVVTEAQSADPDRSFRDAVMTIPVDLDGRGRRELREAARDAGLRVHQFVHEPLAALYGYLRQSGDFRRAVADLGEMPVLVVDWGGGTLDLTLCRLSGATLTQIQSRGEHRVGGDRFDELVRNFVRSAHAERHGLGSLDPVQDGAAARLLTMCEIAKKSLSDSDDALIFVPNYLRHDGEAAHVEVEIKQSELSAMAAPLLDIAMNAVSEVLDAARLSDPELGLVLLTGGMSRMPAVRRMLEHRFGLERVPVVPGAEVLIAHGAAWIAHDAAQLKLAKPLELTLANDHPVELLPVGMQLPTDEGWHAERFPVFCVDPSSGRARMIFTRPVDPGRAQLTDARRVYGVLQLDVDREKFALAERIDLDVVIDADLVVTVRASSELTGVAAAHEIHELEFGLGMGAPDG